MPQPSLTSNLSCGDHSNMDYCGWQPQNFSLPPGSFWACGGGSPQYQLISYGRSCSVEDGRHSGRCPKHREVAINFLSDPMTKTEFVSVTEGSIGRAIHVPAWMPHLSVSSQRTMVMGYTFAKRFGGQSASITGGIYFGATYFR